MLLLVMMFVVMLLIWVKFVISVLLKWGLNLLKCELFMMWVIILWML